MGEQNQNYYNQSLLPAARSAGLVANYAWVDYPAEPVTTLGIDIAKFLRGMDEGVDTLQRQVNDRLAQLNTEPMRCRNSKIVLAGYSQGAGVVHRVLQRRGVAGAFAAHFGGAILFADPDRFNGDGTQGPGSFLSTGVAQAGNVLSGASKDKLSGLLSSNTYSLCASGDPVCAFGPLFVNKYTRSVALVNGAVVHTNAYKTQAWPAYYAFAARALTDKVVKAAPAPLDPNSPTTTTPAPTSSPGTTSNPGSATTPANLNVQANEFACSVIMNFDAKSGKTFPEEGLWGILDSTSPDSIDTTRFATYGSNWDGGVPLTATTDYRRLGKAGDVITSRLVWAPKDSPQVIPQSSFITKARVDWVLPAALDPSASPEPCPDRLRSVTVKRIY